MPWGFCRLRFFSLLVRQLRTQALRAQWGDTRTFDTGAFSMSDTKTKIKEGIDNAADKAKQATDKAVEKTKNAAQTVGEKVKEVGQNIKDRGK
jgi:hypothetical protein